jgi:hypothetical protein
VESGAFPGTDLYTRTSFGDITALETLETDGLVKSGRILMMSCCKSCKKKRILFTDVAHHANGWIFAAAIFAFARKRLTVTCGHLIQLAT